MLDQVFQPFIRELVFIRPVGIVKGGEQTCKRIRIRLFNGHHRINDGFTDILTDITHIPPMAALRDDEGMQLILRIEDDVLSVFLLVLSGFLIVYIGNPLEEQDWNHIALVVVLIDGATHDVARFK